MPNNTIVIPIREDREVMVLNIPYNFTKEEANKIEKIIMAHVNPIIEQHKP